MKPAGRGDDAGGRTSFEEDNVGSGLKSSLLPRWLVKEPASVEYGERTFVR